MSRNKGFTLIELVVSIAILGVVGLAVMGFMTTGSRTYTNVNEEVDLQYEAQLSVNQLRDLIIDANRGVAYGLEDVNHKFHPVDDTDPEKSEAKIEAQLVASNPNNAGKIQHVLLIYNEIYDKTTKNYQYPVVKIRWDPATKELYYATQVFLTQAEVKPETINATHLLATNLEQFHVNLANMHKRELVLYMQFHTQVKEYKTMPAITLRNRVVVSDNLNHIYDKDPIEKDSFVKSVTIKKDGVSIDVDQIAIGKQAAYTADVQVQFGASQEVTWKLTGSNGGTGTGSSVTQQGQVQISPTEKSTTLTLSAISVADTTKQDTMTIQVLQEEIPPYVRSMAIVTPPAETDHTTSEQGGKKTYQFRATLNYYREDAMMPAEKGVTWTCTETSNKTEGWQFNASDGTLTVDHRANGSALTVQATTKGWDANHKIIIDTYHLPVSGLQMPDVPDVDAPQVKIVEYPNVLNRGETQSIKAQGVQPFNPNKYRWSVLDYGSIASDKIKIKQANQQHASISCAMDVPWESAYTITIQVTATDKAGKTATATQTIPIGKVAIDLKTDRKSIKWGDTHVDGTISYVNIDPKSLDKQYHMQQLIITPYTKTDVKMNKFVYEKMDIKNLMWQSFEIALSENGKKELNLWNNNLPDEKRVDYFTIQASAGLENSTINIASKAVKVYVRYSYRP
ncbi:MAG: prepilin-type N-terminal cleavage/methylation domain-containing protein [Lachnospiraceae bacterium]